MKIIHTSDLHLNSKMDKLSSRQATIRREELLHTFERLVQYALDNHVSVIIISGDLFDTNKITNKVFERVMHTIINANEIDFLYLPGNHEQNSFVTMIDEVPNNLKIFNNDWKSFNYGNVVISGVVINKQNSKFIYDELKLNSDNINIVSLHGQIAGYKNNDSEEIISLPLLKDKSIDYLALGHYHSFTEGKIDNRGKFVYSGCLEGRGFDETGDKGFILIDTENKLSYDFVKFAFRSLFEFTFDVSNEDNYLNFRDKLINKLASEVSENSLIKVVLTGERVSSFEINPLNLSTYLNEKFFYAKLVDETTLEINSLDYKNDKSFRGEFIRAVIASDLTDKEKQLIIMKGLNALKGEII